MQKTLKGKILIAVLVTVLAVATALSIGLTLGLNNSNVAEAAKDANFGQLVNGSTWNYTASNYTRPAITVNTNAAHGTATNPYVISNATQWESFANYVNTGKTSASTVAILGANIDFGNTNVTPAGLGTYAYSGSFYGQYFTISNAKMKNVAITFDVSENTNATVTRNVSGLFAFVRGATIGDLSLKNVQVTAHNTNFSCGGLIAVAAETYSGTAVTVRRTTVINVSNTTDYTLSVNATAMHVTAGQVHIGGICGLATEGMDVLRCAYRGKFTVTDPSSQHVGTCIGGLVGRTNKVTTHKVDGCFVDGAVRFNGGGIGFGPTYGSNYAEHHGETRIITNSVFYFILDPASSMRGSTWAGITGCDGTRDATKITITNVYADQNFPILYNWTTNGNMDATYTNVKVTACTITAAATASGHATNASMATLASLPGVTYTAYSATASANLRAQAKTAVNAGQIPGLVVNGDGGVGVVNEAGAKVGISYDLCAADATWSQAATAPTGITRSVNAQNLPCLSTSNAPTRPGFTFKGWAYTKNANATLINSAGTGAIPVH